MKATITVAMIRSISNPTSQAISLKRWRSRPFVLQERPLLPTDL